MFFKIDFRDSKANLNAGFIFLRNWADAGWQPQYHSARSPQPIVDIQNLAKPYRTVTIYRDHSTS
jgi:hypothetical protein